MNPTEVDMERSKHNSTQWLLALSLSFIGVMVAFAWRAAPASGAFDASLSMGAQHQPDQLTRDTAGNRLWAAPGSTNQLARLNFTPTVTL
jgi:hypothetical protein